MNTRTKKALETLRFPMLFSRLIGSGTITIGIGFILCGIFTLISEIIKADLLSTIGAGCAVASAGVGVIVVLYALIRYNKGIF